MNMLIVNKQIDGGDCTFGVAVYYDRSCGVASLSVSRRIHGYGYDKEFEIRELHDDSNVARERAELFFEAITQMGNNVKLSELIDSNSNLRERELVLC
jgi:hypothetical protein